MRFFPGLHQPSDAKHFDECFVSVNRLRARRSAFAVKDWILDSGAFTEISQHGRYRHEVADYAREVRRWIGCGNLLAAVSQDWMCEPHIVAKTGLTIAEHQRRTIDRFDALLDAGLEVCVMPVLQGFAPADYLRHLEAYGDRLGPGAWVGVGSVCKRNGNPRAILQVLNPIKLERPDLRLHGFGLKRTALQHQPIVELLHSADSMAWSFAARREGRNPNDFKEAKRFAAAIADRPIDLQAALF